MRFFIELHLLVSLLSVLARCSNNGAEYWYELARQTLYRRLQNVRYEEAPLEVARNVIVFIGDGMGLTTLTAARILKGQRSGNPGEEAKLVWDDFPAVSLAQTYNADAQVGESAACATALWCGVKANYETIGLDSSAKFENCASSFQSRVPSILTWAQEQGKATGIVTTTRISHATPAGLYAHSPSRYWEDDAKVPPLTRRHCKDIIRQLVEDEPGKNINVLLGGGRRHWFSMATQDPGNPQDVGRRLDGRNLITEWLRNKRDNQIEAKYIWNKQQLYEIDTEETGHLLGLFAYSHMAFEADREFTTEPSLAEMTKTALKILMKNPWGYFLMVEGGRIDHAHHYNNAYRALDETLAFEEAVATALQEVDLMETLVIVTTDHGHVMTFGGHSTKRGNPILGYDNSASDVNDLPYTTLLYGNGPGFGVTKQDEPISGRNTIQQAAAPRRWATHGGEDVPVFATGPLSSVFSGIFDQTYIPHAITYIACLGNFRRRCNCLYFGCETQVLNTTHHVDDRNLNEKEEKEKNDLSNVIMISDQIAAQMRLVSGATHFYCNVIVSFVTIVFLLVFY